ncbi:Ca2+/H+ antiporter [Magnaporthiopsis poae ATCC 64411]|uniref:Vacuolar calcium ion transporter n=1 Tax=Magnaporthiopsis poae (strain ATCC 64411 / 73-15) TaxID=644358 RepID=A0A0C4DL85_MAGP6|nr:Ca2+/H+ antiporter [Magnaporthiopsis poae ATCC 64411]
MSIPRPPPSPALPTRKPSRDRRPLYDSEKSPRVTQTSRLLPTHRDSADFAGWSNTAAAATSSSSNPLREYHDEQKHRVHLHPPPSRQQQQQEYRQKLGLRRTRSMPPFLRTEGESGRNGFHPLHFLRIIWRSSSIVSSYVNILWPVVPAALTVRYVRPDWHLAIFILSYIAMVPCANLVGFAGQELARKVAHVYGVLIETGFGSIVEVILFLVLLTRDLVPVIQAAILGSILATMLLCLGLCFIAGGLRREETEHNEAISEAGAGLLLTAGLGLAIPAIFKKSLAGGELVTDEELNHRVLSVSRGTSILLVLAYLVFVWFQAKTHHGIYDAIFEEDDKRDVDRPRDAKKNKLTIFECAIALAIALTLVTVIAVTLVEQIEHIVLERGISDSFMGLILVPLVEKAAEHLTAVDEAWDDQMNFALSHVLGATLQTALFNAPLVVIVGWILHKPMGLDFQIFDIAMLLIAIVVVGNFLRDGKTNYLEGSLCVIVYVAIAVAAFNYPNPAHLFKAHH